MSSRDIEREERRNAEANIRFGEAIWNAKQTPFWSIFMELLESVKLDLHKALFRSESGESIYNHPNWGHVVANRHGCIEQVDGLLKLFDALEKRFLKAKHEEDSTDGPHNRRPNGQPTGW